jgi:hypothetical protein
VPGGRLKPSLRINSRIREMIADTRLRQSPVDRALLEN